VDFAPRNLVDRRFPASTRRPECHPESRELWSAKRGSGAEPALSAAEGTGKDLKMRYFRLKPTGIQRSLGSWRSFAVLRHLRLRLRACGSLRMTALNAAAGNARGQNVILSRRSRGARSAEAAQDGEGSQDALPRLKPTGIQRSLGSLRSFAVLRRSGFACAAPAAQDDNTQRGGRKRAGSMRYLCSFEESVVGRRPSRSAAPP